MRIVETKVYKFDELTEEGKRKAIEKNCYINVDYDWWDAVYEDAERIGLKITEFDLDRRRYAKGKFVGSALDTANEIIKEHGEHCETFKTAKDYLEEYKKLVVQQCQDEADLLCQPLDYDKYFGRIYYPEEYYSQDEIDTEDIDAEFLQSLCEDYSIMLQKEYEYLTSEEAIIETIEANDYEFTENGELI